MARPEYTEVRARYSLLSVDYLPLWGLRGIASWSLMTLEERISIRDVEIFAVGKIAESPRFSGEEDSSLQTAFPFYILAEGRDIIDRKRIDILLELAETE